ncbi:MAG: mannose-1-phosphate guanylyltransferase [Thermodesulfobacteriota bacterium]
MIYALIMAGGSGTRFWPESRKNRPKQLLNIAGPKSMIRFTVERILPEIPFERIMVITGASHVDEIRSELPELSPEMIVAEPWGRNTAACIALAAFKLQKADPDAVMVVLPADHTIGKEAAFLAALRRGAEALSRGEYLLTFGVVPSRPETGYGYIRLGKVAFSVGPDKVHQVDAFVEKPDLETAHQYVASGDYLWNSGMFVWKVSDIARAIDRHLPRLSTAIKSIASALNTPEETEALRRVYQSLESISIDYGVMERADNVVCIPIDVDWNDVGSWAAVVDLWPSDKTGNVTRGQTLFVDSKNCVVSSNHRLATLIGVEDLIVVDTPDALMICHKDRAQDVRRLQEILAEQGYEDLL